MKVFQILVLGMLFYIGYACGKHDDSGSGTAWANDEKLDQIITLLASIETSITMLQTSTIPVKIEEVTDGVVFPIANPRGQQLFVNILGSIDLPVQVDPLYPLHVSVMNEVEVKEASALGLLVRQGY